MFRSKKRIKLDINMNKISCKHHFKHRTDSSGIGAHGEVRLSKILAFRDRLPAYVSA